jgi:hypothetical protein
MGERSLRFGISGDLRGAFRQRGFAKHITKSAVSASRKKIAKKNCGMAEENLLRTLQGWVRQATAAPQGLN